jgi:hypothetical protein
MPALNVSKTNMFDGKRFKNKGDQSEHMAPHVTILRALSGLSVAQRIEQEGIGEWVYNAWPLS